jgi:hypothetical protein
MRPVLLKSAGIVGLAGAIMAVVSANALFVDPGGPPRDSTPQIVGPSIVTPAPVVFAASPTVADAPEDTTAVPHVVTTVPIAVDEPGDVAATTPIIQPEPVEAEPEAIETLPPVEPAAPEPAVASGADEASAADATAEVASAPLEPPAVAPVDPPATSDTVAAASPETSADQVAEGDSDDGGGAAASSSLWPEEAVECPRDWVKATTTGPSDGSATGCESIASLVRPETASDEENSLERALPADVLEQAVLAPPIPVPGSDAEAKPEAKPKPVRTSRKNDWPAEPPPDCGDKHAFWHFVEGHHGKKEWYCH